MQKSWKAYCFDNKKKKVSNYVLMYLGLDISWETMSSVPHQYNNKIKRRYSRSTKQKSSKQFEKKLDMKFTHLL